MLEFFASLKEKNNLPKIIRHSNLRVLMYSLRSTPEELFDSGIFGVFGIPIFALYRKCSELELALGMEAASFFAFFLQKRYSVQPDPKGNAQIITY